MRLSHASGAALLLLVGVSFFGACDSGASCTPGAQVACACAGGLTGTQVCDEDGDSYSTCDCPTPCEVDPESEECQVPVCAELCEAEVAEGCSMQSDCESYCEGARADSLIVGCNPQFFEFIECAAAEPPCSSVSMGPCKAETEVYLGCYVNYCIDNPDSPACS